LGGGERCGELKIGIEVMMLLISLLYFLTIMKIQSFWLSIVCLAIESSGESFRICRSPADWVRGNLLLGEPSAELSPKKSAKKVLRQTTKNLDELLLTDTTNLNNVLENRDGI
jgi:hypothetical protein